MVGIDFSTKSPAACVLQNNEYIFYSWQWSAGKIHDSLKISGVNVIVPTDYSKFDGTESTFKERTFTSEAEKLTDTIYETLKHHEGPFAIEGFSFGSTGNRLAQLSGYQYLLRSKLAKVWGMENMWVFAPMTVKATAGKGNFNKEKMMDAFYNNDSDPILAKHTFFKAIHETPELFQNKKGAWIKPFDDLVDSFFVLKTLERKCI